MCVRIECSQTSGAYYIALSTVEQAVWVCGKKVLFFALKEIFNSYWKKSIVINFQFQMKYFVNNNYIDIVWVYVFFWNNNASKFKEMGSKRVQIITWVLTETQNFFQCEYLSFIVIVIQKCFFQNILFLKIYRGFECDGSL